MNKVRVLGILLSTRVSVKKDFWGSNELEKSHIKVVLVLLLMGFLMPCVIG
jgi:hypothetical protein